MNKENEIIGSFGIKGNNSIYDLYEIEKEDQINEILNYFPFKPNEKIYRFQTEKMRARFYKNLKYDLMKPLIKINTDKKLIYFLTENGSENEKMEFRTKGIKTLYLNFNE